jgi:hypothetical protein
MKHRALILAVICLTGCDRSAPKVDPVKIDSPTKEEPVSPAIVGPLGDYLAGNSLPSNWRSRAAVPAELAPMFERYEKERAQLKAELDRTFEAETKEATAGAVASAQIKWQRALDQSFANFRKEVAAAVAKLGTK